MLHKSAHPHIYTPTHLPRFGIFALLLFFIVLTATFCNSPEKKREEVKVTGYASLSDTVHYVGMNTCRRCHESIYETFIQTGMGQSFGIASHKKSAAKFNSHDVIYDKYKDFYYKPFWKGDSLYVMEYRMLKGDTVYKRVEHVSYIVGSGQHTNSHIMNVNGYLTQVPMTFYTQKGKWDLPPGFENGANSRFDRKIELECVTCHNSYPQMVEGSENKFDSVPLGINCERCHGPGEAHVKEKTAGHLVDVSKEIDYSIVNPSKLPVALQLDVCQRCHIQGNAVLNEGKSFFDFRPGMHLSDVMNVFMPVYKGQENEHIMASQVERLKMSQCFIQTAKKAEEAPGFKDKLYPYQSAMTCVTCHNPHISVKMTNDDVFNNACKKCHYRTDHSFSTKECSETMEKRNAVSDNCVSCHMPKNGTLDIPHVSVTDHFIRKPPSKNDVQKIREFVTLGCINNPNASNSVRAIAYLNYYEKFNNHQAWLDSAKKYIADNSTEEITQNFNHLIRWAYLKNDFAKVIYYVEQVPNIFNILNKTSYSNEGAWTCYRIGEAYYSRGNSQRASDFYSQAVKLEPYNLEFRNKLGTEFIELDKPDEAKEQFEFIIKENPEFPEAYCNLGYLLLTQHDLTRAEQLYNKALAIDPDYERALLNEAALYIITDRKQQAKKLLVAVLKKHPDDKEAQQALARIN